MNFPVLVLVSVSERLFRGKLDAKVANPSLAKFKVVCSWAMEIWGKGGHPHLSQNYGGPSSMANTD